MLRRVALSGLALLLLLSGLALWLKRDRGARGGPASDAVPSAEPRPAPAPTLAPAAELATEVRALREGHVELDEATQRWLRAQLEVGRGSARIAGTVLWPDGTAATRARVKASRVEEDSSWPSASAETDATGRFVLEGLPDDVVAGIVAFCVPPGVEEPAVAKQDDAMRVPGRTGTRWIAVAESVPVGTNDLVLTLLEPLAVSGTVVDDTGAPVRSFHVRGRPTPDDDLYGAGDSFEAADGAFTLPVAPAGEWSFTAQDPRRWQRASAPVTIAVPQNGATLRLVLPRPSLVTGRVLLPSSGPAADAEVQLDAGPGASEREEAVRTGPDGSFRLEPYAQSLTLRATHPEWAASEPLALVLAPGERQVLLALREGARITGEVVDDDGKPRAGWNVGCASDDRALRAFATGPGDEERRTVTDESGRFVLDHVTPGKVGIRARPAQPVQPEEDGTKRPARLVAPRYYALVVADAEERHVVLRPNRPGPVRVHGRVTEAGEPVARRSVRAWIEGRGVHMSTTDDDGRYELELDGPEDVRLEVADDGPPSAGGARFFVQVPEVDEHEVDLALPAGRIGGTVLGPDGPASRVRLRLVPAAGALAAEDFLDATAAEDGSFAFEHLHAGTYALHVQGWEADRRYGELVVDGLEVADDEALDGVVVRLARPGTLAGSVRDASGLPVVGVPVFVRDSAGRVLAPSDCSTASDGSFAYPGVTPGEVTAIARSASLPPGQPIDPEDRRAGVESSAVTVREGATTTIELFVSAGTYLRVSLLDDERALAARLRVLDALGRRVDDLVYTADFTGAIAGRSSAREHRIGPLAPGSYTLIATTLDGKEVRETVVVELGNGEQEIELRLE